MFDLKRKTGSIFLFFVATSFFLTGVLGLSHVGMTMEPDGSMFGCPFMDTAVVCNMSPLEHIAAWQNMFTATTPENILTALLFLILAAISIVLIMGKDIFPEARTFLFYHPRRFYLFRHPLQEAFSNGVLNSKAY